MRHNHVLSNSDAQPEEYKPSSWGRAWQYLWLFAAVIVVFLTTPAGAVQNQTKTPARSTQNRATRTAPSTSKQGTSKKQKEPDLAWLQEALKNPELMAAVGHLQERLVKELQYPVPRTQSRILARLPESTLFYGALPNYGQAAHQALQILQEELRRSAPLRDFLQKNKLDATELKIEDGLQKFYESSEYLGDEFVITGGLNGKEPRGVLIAEVKKPGLRAVLEKIDQDYNGKSTEHVRIFDPQQLETATDHVGQEPVVLLRPDLVMIGLDVATLRDFNAQLEKGGAGFASNPLGKRLAQAYRSGTNTVMGADLQKLIALVPQNPPQTRMMLEKTGFADAKYVMMENRLSKEQSANESELAFTGPRHGVASWIAAPAPMGGLDFISTKAAIAGDVMLKNPALIFDDIAEIAGPGAFAMLPQMEAQFNVNLKQDLLGKLSGEVAFQLESPPMPVQATAASAAPQGGAIRLILGASDPAGLQQTFKRLLAEAPLQSGERQQDGVTIYTLTIPAGNGPGQEFNYFFLDGYLVIASNRATADEALRSHRSGDSLAKSGKLRESLAKGQPANASAILYQNAGPWLQAMIRQLPPEIAALVPKDTGEIDTKPNVVYAYADETTLRGITSSKVNTDMSVVAVVAAIAIPNLLRSRVAANEAAAAATLRTVNTAEVTYSVTYPKRGYAATLAALGPGAAGDCSANNVTAAHACLLDNVVGNANCTAGKWCEKNGYRYGIRGICRQTSCTGYVVTATPISEGSGEKSFCSTTDGAIRSKSGPPLTAPLTAAECTAWKSIR
jgi:type IV pilus assembly protein PilA